MHKDYLSPAVLAPKELAINPPPVPTDPGVHAWVLLPAAPLAPAHNTHQLSRGYQGTSTVSLASILKYRLRYNHDSDSVYLATLRNASTQHGVQHLGVVEPVLGLAVSIRDDADFHRLEPDYTFHILVSCLDHSLPFTWLASSL